MQKSNHMFIWQKHQHNYFQNYSFQTHLCLTWILVNEIEEILLICLIAFIYINWHIDVGRLYNFKQFDLEKNNCYKGRFEERVTEKLNINHSSIRKTETTLCCLQNFVFYFWLVFLVFHWTKSFIRTEAHFSFSPVYPQHLV